MKSHCFKLHRSYSISFTLSNVGEIFWGWIQKVRTYLTYSIKQVREIEKFHVAVVQQRLRNVRKGRDARAKAVAFLSFSLPSPSSLIRLPNVVIKKFGYHGNVMSHVSSLLSFIRLSTPTGLAADWDWVLPWKIQLVGNTGLSPMWPLPLCEFHAPLNSHFDKIMLNWV